MDRQVPPARKLSDRERDVILLLIRASGERAQEWKADLQHAMVEAKICDTALSLVYPSMQLWDLGMRTHLPVRALVRGTQDAWLAEIVAWSDGAYVSQVEHLWYTDGFPREWPALEDLRVVPEIPLQRF